MALRPFRLLVFALGITAVAQDPAPAPAPVPPTPPMVQAPASGDSKEVAALRAALETMEKRLLQMGEDEILRLAELKKNHAEMAKKLAGLGALPEQVKAAEDLVKAMTERLAAQDKRQATQMQARLDLEQQAFHALARRLCLARKELQGLESLGALEMALIQYHKATSLASNPDFKAVVEVVKDKLSKGPLGNPLKGPAADSFFFNPIVGADWTVASVPWWPGWGDGDKLKNLEKALRAVDLATRMDVEVKAGMILVSSLKAEVGLLKASIEETIQRAQSLVDPATDNAGMDGEVLAAKSGAFFKPFADDLAQGGLTPAHRDRLAELQAILAEAQMRLLERRLLLCRIVSVSGSLAETFGSYSAESSGKGNAALDTLFGATRDAHGRLKAILNLPGLQGNEVALIGTADIPPR